MTTFTIALAQLNFHVGDIEANAKRILTTAKTLEDTADLVIFPELALTGYPPEDLLLRPQLHLRCAAAIENIQSQPRKTALLFGQPQQRENQTYNTASFIDNNNRSQQYDKQHLPNYTVFDEKRYFTAGNKPCIITINNINIGVLICEDLWLQKPITETKAAGADIIVCINASPFAHDKFDIRRQLLQTRSKENAIAILYVNLVGGQDELVFDGGSMVVNDQGEIIHQAAYFKEDTIILSVDKKSGSCVLTPKITSPIQPPPTDRYHAHIYQALVLGVRDYLHKNNFNGAIIGLSGGIDSALTLAIAYDALGPDHLQVLSMPSRYTAESSNTDAETMAATLKVAYQCIPIEPLFKQYLDLFDQHFGDHQQDIARENIQARIRGNLLMALSNMSGKIVLTTGNKSELAVGYCTLYGDMAGGFAVIKDIPKTTVYALCEYRNAISAIIPRNIIDRPPTAELKENQLDQDSLPAYPILDQIIELYVNQDASIDTLYQTDIDRDTIDRVVSLIKRNEYKRRQTPIGIRISERAFGKDRRYPITSGF